MAEKIGSQHGVEAVRQRLNSVDPGKTAYDKLFGEPGKKYPSSATPAEGAILKMVQGHNETLDRLTSLEAKVDALPFL